MIRVAISQAAFDALASTLPLGSVGYENKTDEQGQRLIWLDRAATTGYAPCAGRATAT